MLYVVPAFVRHTKPNITPSKVEFAADPSMPLSEPVEPTDLISIDKFKTSQVIGCSMQLFF